MGLKPLAVMRAQATSGREPEWMSLAPIEAVRKVAVKAGWPLSDVDLFELNEAFSVQALAVNRELGLDPAKVNVHGGAVAIGHPIGASGARVLVTLLYAMAQRGGSQRHRGALPGRRQCRGAGCRAHLTVRPSFHVAFGCTRPPFDCPISDISGRKRSHPSSFHALFILEPLYFQW